MSRLIIGKSLVKTNPKNKFKFVFDFMHGDADGSSTTDFLVDKDNEYLDRFLDFMDAMDNIDPDECEKKDRPKDWYLFYHLFHGVSYEDEDSDEEQPEINHGIDFDWDHDHTCDNSRYAYMTGMTITYFDENGVEHEVKQK